MRKKFNIFKHIAGLSILDCIIRTRKQYKEIRKDPLFINNLCDINSFKFFNYDYFKFIDLNYVDEMIKGFVYDLFEKNTS